jgi:hypothetical protein
MALYIILPLTSRKGVTVHLNSLVGSILDVLFPAIFCSKLQLLQFARLALFELMETSSQKCQSQTLHMKNIEFNIWDV